MAYDIFISYRRDGGGADARMMYDRLLNAGFSVSFDMDTLKNGNFNEELLKRIAECRNFIVILSPGCFDRTLRGEKRENDWLRIEIGAALLNHKNIISVLLPGFAFPDQLPPDIAEIRSKNGPKYDLYFIDAFYDRLTKDFIIRNEIPAAEAVSRIEADLSAVPEPSEADNGVLDAIGDDTLFLRTEVLKKYEAVSRLMPYPELSALDHEWNEAENAREQGNCKEAAEFYLKTFDLCDHAAPCASAFALRMTADGIDTRKPDWFDKALQRAQAGDVDYEYGVGTIYAEGLGIAENTAAAFRWFERAARNGHTQAMGAIGSAYLSGNGVEADYSAAREWLQKAADGGLPSAAERLGWLFRNGMGVKQDLVQARIWYEKAAELNNSAARAALGEIYLHGEGIEPDTAQAVKWFNKAVEDENPAALRILAELKFKETNADSDDSEALNLCRRAMDAGDIESICLLGEAYENGRGVEKDLKKARELYEKAKISGSASAQRHLEEMLPETQYALGLKYMEGRGVPQDFVLARQWFQKASDQGHVNAMAWYGHLLRLGAGGSPDIKTAVSFFEKAAEGGSAVAMVELGRLYGSGSIVKKDNKLAREFYEKAIRVWNKVPPECRWNAAAAFNNLGTMYYKDGNGCSKDLLLAARLYRFAASVGNIVGCHNLAVMYRDGKGVSKSSNEMERWFAEMWHLADLLHPCDGPAMQTLGNACQSGEGCPRDLKTAAGWWHKGMVQFDFSSFVRLDNAGRQHPEILNADDPQKFLDLYRKDAESDNRIAMYNMGVCYRYGRWIKADSKIAAEWFLKSAELGYNNAMRLLGDMYETGDGVEQNKEKGLEWIIKAAEADNEQAKRTLAMRYKGGTSLGRDLTKSMEWLKKAFKDDPENVYTCRMLATAYRDGLGVTEDQTRAQELYAGAIGRLSRMAEDQKAGSQDNLADCYYRGWGVDTDLKRAAELYGKAAAGKDEHAMNQLRRFHRYGVGMEPDRIKSDEWAKCYLEANLRDGGAAARGNAEACISIGEHYRCGYGVTSDPEQAVIWFKRAAEKKSWAAMLKLFRIFHDGECGEPDPGQANDWISRALAELMPLAENGLADAQRNLADCCAQGWGVEKSAEQAVKWYTGAYAGGNWLAAARLACYYGSGEGTAKDEVKALELLNRAAARFSGEAQNKLGECYENSGLGLARDHVRAFELYRSAAAEGNTGGLYNVGRCYAFGIGCEKDPAKARMWLELAAAERGDFGNCSRSAAEFLKNMER